MSLFVVDQEKCNQCATCVDECPRFLVEMGDSTPTPIGGADELCINCGHCVAVCPQGALSLETMWAEECPAVEVSLLPMATQVDQLLRTRRSIRTFEKRSVPHEVLADLIDVARYAPSGSNSQPVEWLVVEDPQDVRRLSTLVEDHMRHVHAANPGASYARTLARATEKGLEMVSRGAPHAIVAHTPRGSEANGVIALTYLELAAYSLGLGACWCGFFTGAANNWPPLKETLGLPEGRVCAGTLLLGYPRYRYQRVPLRNEARVAWR